MLQKKLWTSNFRQQKPLKQEKPLHEGKNINLAHFSVISKENTANKEKFQFPKMSAVNNFVQS